MGISKRVVGGLVGGAIAVFAGTNAMEDKTTRDDAGQIVESGGLGAFMVRTGDCVQLPDSAATEVASVEGVPCETPHDAQVYAEFALPEGSFPGIPAVETAAAEGCSSRWEASFGPFDPAKNLDLTFFTPTGDSWAAPQNDREVTCFVVSADGSLLTGTQLAN